MSSYLIVSALGENQKGLVNELSSLASSSGCNIVDSRMTLLGKEFTVIMLLKGNWNDLATMEHRLPPIASKWGLTTMIKRTAPPQISPDRLPYHVKVIAKDNPGIITDIASFFYQRDVDILDLQSDSYQAPHSQVPMVILKLQINILSTINIPKLRDSFIEFCETENHEVSIKPLLHQT